MTGFSMTRSPSRTLAVLILAVVAWALPAWAEIGEEDENSIRWTNGLHTADLRFNALSANPVANPAMVSRPLNSNEYRLGSGHPDLRDQMEDMSARAFMRYVVSCALAPGQQVEWTDRAGVLHRFEGRIGLCPEWNGEPASPQCQRWVSACVLARNNAEGKRVLFSGRGNRPLDPQPFTPRPMVTTDPFRDTSFTVVASMRGCRPHELGIHRNCGFSAEQVGQCVPGSTVHVGAGGVPPAFACGTTPLGETVAGTMMLRVCEGLHACNELRALAQSAITCSNHLPAVSFTCPASGIFSVISGAFNSAETGEVRVAARDATYPASEEQLFTHPEGGFYGNLFGPGALAAGINVYVDHLGVVHKDVQNVQVSGSIYPKMYACQAPGWERADAYANARLCTLPGTNCVAMPVGRCNATVTSGSYVGPRCQLDNASGHGDYGQCVGTVGDVYPQVVTPYLKHSCDIVSDQVACAVEP